jgi:hypothetical protein
MMQPLLLASFFVGCAAVAMAGGSATSPYQPGRSIRRILGQKGIGVLMIVGIALLLGGLVGMRSLG